MCAARAGRGKGGHALGVVCGWDWWGEHRARACGRGVGSHLPAGGAKGGAADARRSCALRVVVGASGRDVGAAGMGGEQVRGQSGVAGGAGGRLRSAQLGGQRGGWRVMRQIGWAEKGRGNRAIALSTLSGADHSGRGWGWGGEGGGAEKGEAHPGHTASRGTDRRGEGSDGVRSLQLPRGWGGQELAGAGACVGG